MNYTEIKRTDGRTIFTLFQILIYALGRFKVIRKLYWMHFHTYLWGSDNFTREKVNQWKMK